MGAAWIELGDGERAWRRDLEHGLTRIGGRRAHVPLEGCEGLDDELQLWDEPPKLVHLGPPPHPAVNGRPTTEAPLVHGDLVEWRGARFVFRTAARRATLELEADAAVAPGRQAAPSRPRRAPPAERASFARDALSRVAFALAVLALALALALWGRARRGWSVDAWLDRLLGG